MQTLWRDFDVTKYELLANYRSKNEIVRFCNHFASHIGQRLQENDVVAVQTEAGQVDYVAFSGSVLSLLLEKVQGNDGFAYTIYWKYAYLNIFWLCMDKP